MVGPRRTRSPEPLRIRRTFAPDEKWLPVQLALPADTEASWDEPKSPGRHPWPGAQARARASRRREKNKNLRTVQRLTESTALHQIPTKYDRPRQPGRTSAARCFPPKRAPPAAHRENRP